ncbi:hypothetical protein GCM10010412_011290 [Nonomuraea recticatena]|uniref:Lipoprotein n=1 Tax=Nonomuraea recticatena TaxID=46178 RepID=A0ABP6DN39_9ACTN
MLRALVLALALVSLIGCTVNQPTITQSHALSRVEQLIRETAAALQPQPRLELLPSSVAPNTCLAKEGSEKQVVIHRAYWLRDVPQSANMSIAHQVRARWVEQGHVITAIGGFQAGAPTIHGESMPDGYLLGLIWAEGDDLYLAATSPCVWPDGTPAPADR